MADAYQVVRDFEAALCEYTGAPYAVTTSSCTMALLLAVAWHVRKWHAEHDHAIQFLHGSGKTWPDVSIPKRTYVSVPMAIIHAGGKPTFRDQDWLGYYQLKPLPVFDCARWFSSNMFDGDPPVRDDGGYQGNMLCVSFHASKILGDTQGGAILHDDDEADAWLRRARFDGRVEGVAPKDDSFTHIGWHCYMSPDVAARLRLKLATLPRHNAPLPNDDYPDLSAMEIFRWPTSSTS